MINSTVFLNFSVLQFSFLFLTVYTVHICYLVYVSLSRYLKDTLHIINFDFITFVKNAFLTIHKYITRFNDI